MRNTVIPIISAPNHAVQDHGKPQAERARPAQTLPFLGALVTFTALLLAGQSLAQSTLPVYIVTQNGARPDQAANLASALGIPSGGYALDNGQVSFIDPTNWMSVPTIAVTDPVALSNLNCAAAAELDRSSLSNLIVLGDSMAFSKTAAALSAADLTSPNGLAVLGHATLVLNYTNTDQTVVSNSQNLDTQVSYQLFADPNLIYPLVGPGAQVQVHYPGGQ